MNDEKTKTIEIYALSKTIDKIDINEVEGDGVKITVNLKQVDEEEKYLKDRGLYEPKKEQESLRKVAEMKRAKALKEELLKSETPDNEIIERLDKIITEGDSAIEHLIKVFEPSALYMAKGWIHNDTLNDIDDWKAIVQCAVLEAILTYDMTMPVQFNTWLRPVVMKVCKENKSQNSTVTINASAMHKARQLRQAEERVRARGGNVDDDYEVAKEMGREILTEYQLENFRKMRIDMEMVFPETLSLETTISDESSSSVKTLADTIASDSATPEELCKLRYLKEKFLDFYGKLPPEMQDVVIALLKGDVKKKDNPNMEKVVKKLASSRELHEILTEISKLKSEGVETISIFEGIM